MINFLQCLGFAGSSSKDIKQLRDYFNIHQTFLELPHQTLRSMRTLQGLEIWQAATEGHPRKAFNFHYRSTANQTGILRERINAPEKDVEGLFSLQVGAEQDLQIRSIKNPEEPSEPHNEGYSILFQPPNYAWYDHLALPCRATVQLAAFPESVQLYPAGTKNVPVGKSQTELGVCYILMREEAAADEEEPILPFLEFGGIIRTLTSFVNTISTKLVYAATVESAGLNLDLLIPPEMVTQIPKPGMVVQAQCWLTGRIHEIFPPNMDVPLVFLLQTQVAGTYYHSLGERTQEFAFWDELALVREPQNPYDPQAIAVQSLEGEKIGYIPREKNAPLAARMDRGEKLSAYLAQRYHHEGQAEQFVIRIYSRYEQNS